MIATQRDGSPTGTMRRSSRIWKRRMLVGRTGAFFSVINLMGTACIGSHGWRICDGLSRNGPSSCLHDSSCHNASDSNESRGHFDAIGGVESAVGRTATVTNHPNASHNRRCCSRSRASARTVPSIPNSRSFRSTSAFSRVPCVEPTSAPAQVLSPVRIQITQEIAKANRIADLGPFGASGLISTIAESTFGRGKKFLGSTLRTISTWPRLHENRESVVVFRAHARRQPFGDFPLHHHDHSLDGNVRDERLLISGVAMEYGDWR